MTKPIDYSSQSYWEARLAKEEELGYEWLVPSAVILPVVASYIRTNRPSRVLHFGCGSSSLGIDMQRSFGTRVSVSDSDYAVSGLRSRITEGRSCSALGAVPLLEIDVLSLPSLLASAPASGWDLLVDKSTADAISCGPLRETSDSSGNLVQQEALELLCDNLATVVFAGGYWVSISYSSSRFDFLGTLDEPKWRVIKKVSVKLSPTTATTEGIVYQPETGVWAWVLERT